MKTTITVLHHSRDDLSNVLGIIRTEINQRYQKSSGTFPCCELEKEERRRPTTYMFETIEKEG